MHFLAPIFAAFTILAGVPILIHLIGRSRARLRRFPAMDLLLGGHRRVARRTQLRQLLLLLLRALVMAAVPLCLAKPFIEAMSDLPPQVSGAQSAVIILDDSVSMNYRLGGQTLLQRGKARAGRILGALGSSAEASLLLGSRGAPAPVAELTGDRARLVRALSAVQPSYRPADLGAAVKRAAQILAGAQRGGKRIYLLSHLSARALDAGVVAPDGVEVVPIDVAEGKPLPNRAVVDLHVDPAPSLGPGGVRVTAEIANHGDSAIKELPVTLQVDGKAVARGLLDLAAGGRAAKRFYHVLDRPGRDDRDDRGEGEGDGEGKRGREARGQTMEPGRDPAGIHDVSVQLLPDELQADDQRFLRVELERRLKVLVVDGDPRNLRRDDEIFYLEMALHPGERDDAQIEVTIATPDELPRRPLQDFDAVLLCNVKAQDAARSGLSKSLPEYVRGGGGLLLALGDSVDADAYNQTLGEVLPQPLAGAKTTGAVRRPGDEAPEREAPRDSGGGERLGRIDRRHPLLQPFSAGHAAESLLEARFFRYMLLRPTARGAESAVQTMLWLDSGAPALIERQMGKGRVLLFLSSIDRDWNDLPIQPAFLPLVQQAVRYLAGSPMRDPEPPALVGQRQEIKLQPGDSRVEVTLPSGQKRLFERERLQGRKQLGFQDTEEPGVYRVSAASEASKDRMLRPRPAESFVVNVDAGDSDLRRASAQRIEQLSRPAPGAGPGGKDGAAPRRRVELWHAIGALLLLLLVGEALLLREK